MLLFLDGVINISMQRIYDLPFLLSTSIFLSSIFEGLIVIAKAKSEDTLLTIVTNSCRLISFDLSSYRIESII